MVSSVTSSSASTLVRDTSAQRRAEQRDDSTSVAQRREAAEAKQTEKSTRADEARQAADTRKERSSELEVRNEEKTVKAEQERGSLLDLAV